MTRSAKQIFEEVCDLELSQRETALRDLCCGNTQLRAEIDSLLSAHDAAGEFLNEPTIDVVDAVVATENELSIAERPGSVIDRYKLLEQIGEGGFGVVFMAQQSEPIRRRVALKIIKLGMDTKQVVARFEAERQALAMLDHPNIARVIDAGSTETGRPYFVMELVRGEPITRFCDQKRLPLQARLELFQQVCRAIEHAHQKGIIHRDIKPSNVLVTVADDKPIVKVIDFGIAKATNCELTEKTLFTEFRQLIGTPLYMSPEQAERSGVDVDTRTDIYSLGVLLYEILTGRTPLDPNKLNSVALGELHRMIVEDEPSKPSVMVTSAHGNLSEIAKQRGTEATRLGTLLRGDLDWIVLKAIEKERSRRYLTATHFVADIDRFLNHEAVEATPPSAMYQLRKFARRNRVLITTVAAVFLALVAGLVATGAAATWAFYERGLAEQSRDRAEEQVINAQKAATLAAASLMLPEHDARAYAKNWLDRIHKMSAEDANPEDQIRAESQYAAWFSGWLMAHGKNDEAKKIIDRCYDTSRELIGTSDPTFLALCNSRIRVNAAVGADANRNADTFADLIEALHKIHGQAKATELLPEYAAALAAAHRYDDASKAIREYLDFHEQAKTKLTPIEHLRLDVAIDRLVQWGHSHPDLMTQLVALRQIGSVVDSDASNENDEELKDDLATLQGTWRLQQWERGKLIVTVIQRFEGKLSHSKVLGDGDPGYGREGRIELTRNGGVKVMHVYLGGTRTPTVSYAYQLKPNRLFLAVGLLTNMPTGDDIRMNTFYRISDEEAEKLIQENGSK